MKSEQDDDLKDVMAAEKRRGRSNRPTEAAQEKKIRALTAGILRAKKRKDKHALTEILKLYGIAEGSEKWKKARECFLRGLAPDAIFENTFRKVLRGIVEDLRDLTRGSLLPLGFVPASHERSVACRAAAFKEGLGRSTEPILRPCDSAIACARLAKLICSSP
ncbi:MAG TPA: hypothetical protein VHX49_01545 [Candidatus Acidoferrales bacterium]|jgi:hypothetical protein|nr:hypothetical protein [Candidatus Acidoferrales bacterium]